MVKNKKNAAKKPPAKSNAKKPEPIQKLDYDSMIENGTSEEDESDQEIENGQNRIDTASSTSDDGFSEREESDEQIKNSSKRKLLATNPNGVSNNKNSNAIAKKKRIPDNTENPPTLEEINELKETRNLYHSNLFRLQIKEMLLELKLKDKYTNYVQRWLNSFKTFLQALENAPEKQNIDELRFLKQTHVKVPLSLQGIQSQKPFQFQFLKPTSPPMLIGAASTQTLLGPKLVVDVCVLMPAACFQKENFLNLVYDQKRAYYLTYLVHNMQKHKDFKDDTYAFNYLANNPLKPVLELTPDAVNKLNKLCIRVHIAAEEQSFKLNRFVPWNSNVRATLYGDETDEDAAPLATPHYNANVLHDLTLQRNHQLLQETFEGKRNFQEGLLLLKVWLRQRQLNVGYSGFNAHIMAMYIVFLYKQHKLNANMSSYQVARNVWNQLAASTWDEAEKSITLSMTTDAHNQPTLGQFSDYYEVVFVDVTGFYNICANLPLEMYKRVREEAKLAVEMLNDMKVNSFQYLFMTKLPIYTQVDNLLKINQPDAIEQLLELHVSPADKYDTANFVYPQLLKLVKSLLNKGLGKRIKTLLPIEQTTESWSINSAAPNNNRNIHLGIILNPEHAFEVLERGPESFAPDAEEFRKFWGDKAQLRRFQDGSIIESVVWGTSTDTPAKKRLIVRTIVLHLLQHHYQLESKDYEYIGGEFDVLYKLTAAFKTEKLFKNSKVPQDTDAEAMTPLVIHCFDELVRQMHELRELPVEIVGIAGTSSIFKYCEPEPVLPQARIINQKFFATHVHHAVIQLGLSGNWPSELTALRALKTAFYIQISQLLRDKHNLQSKVTYEGILVYKKGYCFALELAHPKEVALLKKQKVGILTQYEHCPASIALERKYYVLPKVTAALHSLYQAQTCFGPTVMIAKRWLGTQLIDSGLWPDEVTELLVASLFLNVHPTHQTNAPQTGFILFLQLLAITDWQSELFLLNFNNAMEESDISDLEKRYRTKRETFPPLTIATSYDLGHYGLLWSAHDCPNVNVLARVTLLARQALAILEPALLSPVDSFIKPSRLFTASHMGYDLVIQLKPDQVPSVLCCEFGSPFAALNKPNWRLPLAGTNTLRDVIWQLREAYSDYAAFFYNPYGGKEIGVVWKPDEVFAPKDFKVNDVNGCTLITTANKVQCLKETLVEDFKFILKDYYLRIGTVGEVLRESRESAKRYFAQPASNNSSTETKQKSIVKSKNKMQKLKTKIVQNSKLDKKIGKIQKPNQLKPTGKRKSEFKKKKLTK